MRSGSGTRKTAARRFATVMAAVGALLVSSGIALMAAPTPANADVCVPKAASTETTDWVDASPGAGWYQVDSRVKTPATEGHWTNLVWHNYTGNEPDPEVAPALDDPNWHALPADPQAENHTVPPRVPNVPYNVSNESSGNGSWFLWTGTWVPGANAVNEYRFAFDHPAVTCQVVPPVVSPPTTTTEVSPPKAHVKAKTEVKAQTTPTVVHAGLAGFTSGTTVQTGLGLTLAGLLLMAGAAGLALEGGERKETT